MNHPVPTTGFSTAAYSQLLAELRARGYRLADYTDADPEKPHLILRHDVDVCVERALALAEFEATIDATSTYFFLLRTPLYNLMDEIDSVKHIAALGHGVGLHFDASLYPPADWQDAIARECAAFEALLGQPIEMVSFHRPAKELLNYPHLLAGRMHAYLPRFFSQMGYSTDSRGGWYRGHPLEQATGKALQLVTHPIWWIAEENESASDKLKRFVAGRDHAFREALAYNITPYQEVLHAETERQ